MPINITPRHALAWVLVYFCRVVLVVNGIIYAQSGVAYIDSTYQALAKFAGYGSNNTAGHIFPQLVPVIKDRFIESQNAGIIVLAPFMGCAYACVGFTSLAAAVFFGNVEAALTLFLQAALLSMGGCIVRPSIPADFYNAGTQDGVQRSQMVAVVMGFVGALALALGLALRKQGVRTPMQHATRLLGCASSPAKDMLRIEGEMVTRTSGTEDDA